MREETYYHGDGYERFLMYVWPFSLWSIMWLPTTNSKNPLSTSKVTTSVPSLIPRHRGESGNEVTSAKLQTTQTMSGNEASKHAALLNFSYPTTACKQVSSN